MTLMKVLIVPIKELLTKREDTRPSPLHYKSGAGVYSERASACFSCKHLLCLPSSIQSMTSLFICLGLKDLPSKPKCLSEDSPQIEGDMKTISYDLKKYPLMLEMGTPLQLDIAGFHSRFKSALVGVLPNEYLIVKAPQLTMFVGEPKHILPGSEVVVRCLHRGNVWGFESKLKRMISTPAQLLMLEYPETMENFNLRSNDRIDCLLPGKIQLGKTTRKGVVVDISEQGCRFSIKNGQKRLDIQVDAELTLKCQLPGIEGDQDFTGHVRRVEQDELRTLLGVQFDKIDSNTKKTIAKYALVVSDAAS